MIQSRSNLLVKLARSLRERKAREETGLFLVEGIHHVGEAIQAGWKIEAILHAPDSLKSEFAKDLLAKFDGRQEAVSTDIMDYVASKENPSGILAIVHQQGADLARLGSIRQGVAIVAAQDPGNVGTIIRTMDACGAQGLFLLDGGVDAYHPTAIRAAMGASFRQPIAKSSFAAFVAWARERGCQLLATSAHADRSYMEWRPTDPWILVLGSEQKGLTVDQTKACDIALTIPMVGRVSSLNLAVAASILLYHFAAPGETRVGAG